MIVGLQLPREVVDVNVTPDKRTIMLNNESRILAYLQVGLPAIALTLDLTRPERSPRESDVLPECWIAFQESWSGTGSPSPHFLRPSTRHKYSSFVLSSLLVGFPHRHVHTMSAVHARVDELAGFSHPTCTIAARLIVPRIHADDCVGHGPGRHVSLLVSIGQRPTKPANIGRVCATTGCSV